MADRFIVLGADNSELVVTPAQVPKTVTLADLEPFEGTLPTFDPAPLVSVMGAGHQRHFDVDTVGKTTFRIIASSSGGAPTNATLNIEIIFVKIFPHAMYNSFYTFSIRTAYAKYCFAKQYASALLLN